MAEFEDIRVVNDAGEVVFSVDSEGTIVAPGLESGGATPTGDETGYEFEVVSVNEANTAYISAAEGSAVVGASGSSGEVYITVDSEAGTQIYAKAAEGQTDALLDLKNSDGNPVTSIWPSGTGSYLEMSVPVEEGMPPQVFIEASDSNAYVLVKAVEDQTEPLLNLKDSDGNSRLSYVQDTGRLTVAEESGDAGVKLDASNGLGAVYIAAGAAQTDPLLEMYGPTGDTVFMVEADGSPVIYSPDGTGYRLKVDNSGVLSTEEV